MARYDLIVRNGTLVLPWGEVRADLAVTAGRIAAIGVPRRATRRRPCSRPAGLHVLPGIIDPHVHFRDSGQGHVDASGETMETGTRGAVLGGVTTIFDMPNTQPSLVDAAALAAKQAHAERVAWCDVGLYVGATKGNVAALAALERGRGVCAIKVFAGSSTGDLLVEDDASIDRVLAAGTRRVAFHSEDEARLQARKPATTGAVPTASTCAGATRNARSSARAGSWRWRNGREPAGPHPARLHRGGARMARRASPACDRGGAGQPSEPVRARGLRAARRRTR